MKVEIVIDEMYKEPKVMIMTDKITDNVNSIIRKLSDDNSELIAGFMEDHMEVLDPLDIYRIFSESGKVYAETDRGQFKLRLKLYEAEQRLEHQDFIRISNTDIINLRKVKNFDLSFVGTICIVLLNGTVTYASRRSVAKIKKRLGI